VCFKADDIQADTTTATLINKPLRVSHNTLGRVRSLESRFLPLRPILVSFEEVADGLQILGQDLVARGCVTGVEQRLVDLRLENAKRYARTFRRTAIFLQERSNNTATLLSDTLAFRNQGIAQDQNSSMVILTRSAVFITVITLVYLPWTLVTVCRMKCW
jgi:Mg2+ and Co2+ transporter CorA